VRHRFDGHIGGNKHTHGAVSMTWPVDLTAFGPLVQARVWIVRGGD
jgi:hypothetical protein